MTKAQHKKLENLWIYIDVYNAYVLPALGFPMDVVNEYVMKEYGVSLNAGGKDAATYCFKNPKGRSFLSVIHMPEIPKDPIDLIGLLTHEVIHACMFTLNDVGQKIDNEDHEHFCYLTQKVLTQALFNTKVLNSLGKG